MSTTFIDSVTAAMTAVALRWRVGDWLGPGWIGYGFVPVAERGRRGRRARGRGVCDRVAAGGFEGEADGVETLRR